MDTSNLKEMRIHANSLVLCFLALYSKTINRLMHLCKLNSDVLPAHKCQKWQSIFFPWQCQKINVIEAVALSYSIYGLQNKDFCDYMKIVYYISYRSNRKEKLKSKIRCTYYQFGLFSQKYIWSAPY